MVFYDGLQSVELYWEHFFIRKHILYLVVQKIMTPINAGKACIYRKSKRLEHRNIKLLRSLKKRLTVGIKLLKITLCKHTQK